MTVVNPPSIAAALGQTQTIGPPVGRGLTIGDLFGVDGFGGIWQPSNPPGSAYALYQDNLGNTGLNAGAGKTLQLAIGNTGYAQLVANLFKLLAADLAVSTVGRGLQVKEGANARMGVSGAAAAGVITINNSSIGANTRVFIAQKSTAGKAPYVETARTPGTSITLGNGDLTDSATVLAYFLVEPAA